MEILKELLPKKEEKKKLEKAVKNFLSKFKKYKVSVGGSYAKNTWLSGDADVDVFFRFGKGEKNISKELSKILKKKFKKVELVHGSRDYYHVKFGDISFEVVPVLDIRKSSDAENVTDVTLLHVKFVKKNTNVKLCNEIRLLKQFCKANGLYGAESYISGFSGYVLELLMIHYKNFKNLVRKVGKWGNKEVIDVGKCYKTKKEAIKKLNPSKKVSPLILIDPVQCDRNVAAALSKKNYEKFIGLCKSYDGSESFFRKKDVDVNKLKGYIVFKVKVKKGKKDIVGAKLVKKLEKLKKEFEKNDFKVHDYGWKWDKAAYFWFKTDKKVPSFKKHYGPFVKQKEHVKVFKKKWGGVKKEKKRYYVNVKRKFIDVKSLVKVILKDKDLSIK